MSAPIPSTANLSPEERRALLAKLLREKARATVTTHPAGYGQRALWYIHELAPESSAYNVGSALRLRHKVNVSALQGALQTLVDRHEALRTHFATTEAGLVQSIAGAEDLSLTHVDAAGWSDHEVDEKLTAAHRRPFDLQQGPLLRVHLFTRAEDDHLLLISLHHSITDGWSVGVLLQELDALYTAGVEGRSLHPPAAGAPYVEFVRRQMEMLSGPEGEQMRAYWMQQLSGELPQLNLPTDHPRPPVQRLRGAAVKVDLAPELLRALDGLAHAEQTTLFAVLVAAYQLLLHRYTGQDDIIVGTPMAGRTHGDFYGTLGYFVNAVALRTDFSAGTDAPAEALTFRRLLKRVRRTVIDALAHQEYPFALLVEQLNPPRDPSRSAIFETTINLMRAQHKAILSEGDASPAAQSTLYAEIYPLEQQAGQFDLMLDVVEDGPVPHAIFSYNTDLFEESTIRRMAGHYLALLTSIVADPDQAVDAIPLLTPAERKELLDFNATERPYNLERRLHDWIADQSARTSESTALRFEGEGMSFAALDARSNQVAHALQARGVGPNTLVGVFAERSFEMVIALLAVLKSGGAYVPIDPSYPRERITMMLEDAAPPVVLAAASVKALAELPTGSWTILDLRDGTAALDSYPVTPPTSSAGPDDLAYVIFTSGSTGRPKGASVHHRAIVNRLLWMQEEYQLTADDVVLQKTPFSFDVSVWEFFWPLMIGTPLVIARPEGHKDSAYLIELIESERITTLHFVPSMLQAFLKDPNVARCNVLKRVICSGEALPLDLQERFFELLPSVELHNLYGPTEAAVDVSYWPCRPKETLRSVPIGYPVANTQLYVLDRLLQLVPLGVMGELHIGGVQVGKGYVGRPELTAEKFIEDPFSLEGGRLYKTGDLARHLSDGAIEYLGRLDHQVKIRGFRIELGEIESVLNSFPGVRESVVTVHTDARRDRRLVAYLVVDSNVRPGAGELRSFLSRSLPDYMVPSAFLFLDQMPLSPNGKVDRRALPAPEPARARRDESFAAPATPTEQAVAAIWREVLGIERAGVYDNFFDLGGHSLNAIEALAACERALGARLHPGLLRTQTLGQVAASYDELRQAQPAPVSVAQAEPPPAPQAAPPDEQDRAGLAGRMWGAMRRALKPDDKQG